MKYSIEKLKQHGKHLDLTFNHTKTKYLLISSKHMSKKHNITKSIPEINICRYNRQPLLQMRHASNRQLIKSITQKLQNLSTFCQILLNTACSSTLVAAKCAVKYPGHAVIAASDFYCPEMNENLFLAH